MGLTRCISLFAFALLFTACAQKPAQWTAGKPLKTLEGFAVPECAVVDPASGAVYVSNIDTDNEGYWVDDGKGFISRLKSDGSIEALRWRDSTAEAPIHSPKGMCIVNGVLFVADNTRVLRFRLPDGQALPPIVIPEAKWLNDMASDGRRAWVSDTGASRIYCLEESGPRQIKAPKNPNGITFDKGRMFGVSWDLHEVYELDPTGKKDPQPFGLASHFHTLDAIEVLKDGSFLVSDFGGNKVAIISPDRKTVTTIAELKSPADVGLDRKRNRLYVPSLLDHKVMVYSLEKQARPAAPAGQK